MIRIKMIIILCYLTLEEFWRRVIDDKGQSFKASVSICFLFYYTYLNVVNIFDLTFQSVTIKKEDNLLVFFPGFILVMIFPIWEVFFFKRKNYEGFLTKKRYRQGAIILSIWTVGSLGLFFWLLKLRGII